MIPRIFLAQALGVPASRLPPIIKSSPYPKLNEHNMKNAFTATLTTLLLLLMVGIVFLSDMGNATSACCYVGCPPHKPNCRAW